VGASHHRLQSLTPKTISRSDQAVDLWMRRDLNPAASGTRAFELRRATRCQLVALTGRS
jgi:hypothetical protein